MIVGILVVICLNEIFRDDGSQGAMNIKEAMKEVLKESLKHDGLARGIREAVKALDK